MADIIKDMREKQARMLEAARSKMDEITDKTDESRTAEIETEYDAIMADFDKLEKSVEREETMKKAEDRIASARRPNHDGGQPAGNDETISYRDAFHQYLKAQGQLSSMNPEARAVLNAGFTKYEQRAQTSGTDSEGGFTVPEELRAILVKSMLDFGPMFDPGITTEIVTTSGTRIPIPTVDDTTKAVDKHVEGTTLTDDGGDDVVFAEKVLEAFSFNTGWVRVSKELVDDSVFNMEQLLGSLLGERLGRRANLELTTGDGTGDPNGIVTASTAGKTAALNSAITWDEILDLEHSVDPAYRVGPKVRYMFNDSTLKAVRKLKDGEGNFLWQMGDVRGGMPATFNGHNFSINQQMASIGATAKIMLFGDFSKYFVRKVGSPLIGAIQDKDFWPGFGIAGHIRFDGELVDTAAVKHLIMAA